jgi:hypothetical protein
VDSLDLDRLLSDLSRTDPWRRDKIRVVRKLVRTNRYETEGKLLLALERLIGELDDPF